MKKILTFLACCLVSTSFSFTLSSSDYGTLPMSAQSMLVSSKPDKIQVTEFFSIACPHCYKFEPVLEKWEKTAPKNVVFKRYPVGFGQPLWKLLARAYFTAKAMDKKPLVDAMFTAIHKDHQPLFTQDAIATFFAENGVAKATFDKYFNSFSISQQLAHSAEVVKVAKIMEVPALVVDGRYYTNPGKAGNFKKMLQVVDALVKKANTMRRNNKQV